ncbi:hypothetical protein FACS1894211_15310 [Clostridia bacterium]|nr:hypothetical protein FACS1894211_15310 [Clostridia bacterium]
MKIFGKGAENPFYKKGFPQIKALKNKFDRFLFGDWFFPFCAAVAVLSWQTGAYWTYAVHIAVSVFAVILIYLLFFCETILPAVPIVAVLSYMLPGNFKLGGFGPYIPLAVWLTLIVAGFVYYFVKRKPAFQKSRLFWPTVVFGAAMFFAGLLSPWYFEGVNFLMILYLGLLYPFVTILLFNTARLTLEYVAKTILTAGAVILLEMLLYYAGVDAHGQYKAIHLGWGMSNNMATVFTMAIVASFYLSLTKGKADVYYAVAAFVFIVALLFTESRGCIFLLAAALPFIVGFYLCRSARGERGRRAAILLICTAVSLAASLIFIDEVASVFALLKEMGLKENGRTELYKEAWEVFKGRPIFGAGFAYPTQLIPMGPLYPVHNTILQFMASGGIVGVGACLYLFGSRYRLLYDAYEPKLIFFAILMLLFEIYGMVEMATFCPYAVFLTCVLFNALEQEHAAKGKGMIRRRKFLERKKWIF